MDRLSIACWYPTLACMLYLPAAQAAITVTEPAVDSVRVTQGQEYSVYEVGNPWDMNGMDDIAVNESRNLTNLSFTGGVLSYDAVESPNIIWLVYPGLPQAFRGLDRGERFPMDTARYRFLTIKLRMNDLNGQPLTTDQPFIVRFFEDASRLPADAGILKARSGTYADWTVIGWDLNDPLDYGPNSNYFWTDFPLMRGLRFNPTNQTGVHVEIDWVRLSAAPSAATNGTVAWVDDSGSGPYDVGVTDGDFTWILATTDNGTSAEVDLSRLPAGVYAVSVTDGVSTGFSSGTFAVNDAPVLHLTTPDRRGDPFRAYGIVETGNSWADIDAGDIAGTPDITNVSFNNPPGTLTGRPTSSDPRIVFNTTTPIDTTLYRMLCYTLEVKGPRDIGHGSIARIFWGDSPPTLMTGDDIVVNEGLNEYCVGDMADFPTEGGGTAWTGTPQTIRLDPHEFPVADACTSNPSPENCRDIRVDRFVLAPFHRSPGGITLRWDAVDNDDDPFISLYFDPDRLPFNGNEGVIVENLAQSAAAGSFQWNTATIANGIYNVLSVIDDGRNMTRRYATGPVEVVEAILETIFIDSFE